MSKTSSIAVRWVLIAFTSGMIAGVFVNPALHWEKSELNLRSAARLIMRLTSNVERDIHVLVLPSTNKSEECQVYLDSNYEDIASRLFHAKLTDPESLHEDQLEQFLRQHKLSISLPAHLFVRRSELGSLIRIDSQNDSWMIRQQEPGGHYTIVGLK